MFEESVSHFGEFTSIREYGPGYEKATEILRRGERVGGGAVPRH